MKEIKNKDSRIYSLENVEWYLSKVKEEMMACHSGEFWGPMSVEINFHKGGITNMNIGVKQSFRNPETVR